MSYEKMKHGELLAIIVGIGMCLILFGGAFLARTRPVIWTVEVYEIFEVVHKNDTKGQDWTFVYTYGQGQYFFKGDWDIKPNCSYVFTYHENGKRWRDLTMVEPPREFIPLVRENDDCGCPN